MKKLNIKNSNIKISVNKYENLYLEWNNNLNFSISHADDFVVCIIDDTHVGIDVEMIGNI